MYLLISITEQNLVGNWNQCSSSAVTLSPLTNRLGYPQNRKYITFHNPRTASQRAQKIWLCGFRDMADRQTRDHRHTHHNTLQFPHSFRGEIIRCVHRNRYTSDKQQANSGGKGQTHSLWAKTEEKGKRKRKHNPHTMARACGISTPAFLEPDAVLAASLSIRRA